MPSMRNMPLAALPGYLCPFAVAADVGFHVPFPGGHWPIGSDYRAWKSHMSTHLCCRQCVHKSHMIVTLPPANMATS
jgi:hypothetical protein